MIAGPLLVATDFSDEAANAALAAARLADRQEDVWLVNVAPALTPTAGLAYPGAGAFALPTDLVGVPAVADREAMERRLADWRDEIGLPRAQQQIVYGWVGRDIAREADEINARLIVMGATGHSRLERVLVGTNATSVLHSAHRDVLLVRGTPGENPPFARVLVATDLHDPTLAPRSMDILRTLQAQGAEVSLVHVRDRTVRGMALEPDEVARRLHALNVEHFEGSAREVIVDGRPSDELPRVATDERADLLVVGDREPGAISRLLLGNVAANVVERAPCSVLVVRTGRSETGTQE